MLRTRLGCAQHDIGFSHAKIENPQKTNAYTVGSRLSFCLLALGASSLGLCFAIILGSFSRLCRLLTHSITTTTLVLVVILLGVPAQQVFGNSNALWVG